MDQSRNRSGEFYETQVRKQLKYWRTEARRLGIRG